MNGIMKQIGDAYDEFAHLNDNQPATRIYLGINQVRALTAAKSMANEVMHAEQPIMGMKPFWVNIEDHMFLAVEVDDE